MQITIEQEKERLRKQIDSLNEKDTEKKLELETQLSQLELIHIRKIYVVKFLYNLGLGNHYFLIHIQTF